MKNTTIVPDLEKCIGCGQCVKDCPGNVLSLKDGKVSVGVGCIACGHCYAICPTEAIQMEGYDLTGCGKVTPMTELDSDTLLQAMKSRRTVRRFKDEPVPQEKIDKIIEAGRYCPTGGNAQDVAYTILGSKQDAIEKKCVSLFKNAIAMGSVAVPMLKNLVIDDKFFFKGAPLVIAISGKSGVNAALAASYMEIMAESLGLGVLYSGFFAICAKMSPKIRKELNLPKGHKVVTCMIMGTPDVQYHRIAPRKPANVNKL